MDSNTLTAFLFIIFATNNQVFTREFELKQVLVLSRHSIRAPLSSTLALMTPKKLPKWDVPVGALTQKGALLESYMGNYFAEWLKKKQLLTSTCPKDKEVFIYANSKQRTIETAVAFSEAAFPNCNVTVNYKNVTEMDPIFNPVYHNTSKVYKEYVLQEMQEKLHKSNLKESYLLLNDIIDIKRSQICIEEGLCDLSQNKNVINFKVGQEPNVSGPLHLSTSMVDSFVMSFYEGKPASEVAWGEIENEEQWYLLTEVLKEIQNVDFNSTRGSQDLAKPLLKFMKKRIDSGFKFNLLVGHDSNLVTVIRAMGFKKYVLPGQSELTPIGGKLVFQKWTNGTEDFLKVEFVYQSRHQLRNGEKLSLSKPPQKVTLYLSKCKPNKCGFCNWRDFEQILNDLTG